MRRTMTKVTVLGLGAMGSRMAANLFYSGGAAEAAAGGVEPLLRPRGSAIHYVGPLGSGALVKLPANALMGVQVTVFAEIIGLLKSAGADPAAVLKAMSSPPAW